MTAHGRIFAFCAALLLTLCPPLGVSASEPEEERTVRVAYPSQAGMTEMDGDGHGSGYTYEYLREISQYTGWEYTFVPAPEGEAEPVALALTMLRSGRADLAGGVPYSAKAARFCDYSEKSCGISYTLLQVLYEDTRTEVNARETQTMRIAVPEDDGPWRERLKEFCGVNLIDPVLIPCAGPEAQMRALREDRADALLGNDFQPTEGLRTIARFSPQPLYFAAPRGRSALLRELDAALGSIEQADPTFSAALTAKYFSPVPDDPRLVDAELEYIRNSGTLRVGILTNYPPLQYTGDDGQPKGIAVDLLRHISRETGLDFRMVPAEDQDRLFELVHSGEVDMTAGMLYDYELAAEHRLAMTRPYINSQYIMVLNKDLDADRVDGKRLALPKTSRYDGYFIGRVVRFDSPLDCLLAVSGGDADYAYVDGYMAQYYINRPEFRNIRLIPQTYDPPRTCFGICRPADPNLLRILNKAIAGFPETELQAIIYRNTIFHYGVSPVSLMREYPVITTALTAAVLLGVIVLLACRLRRRTLYTREIALELKKHRMVYELTNDYYLEYSFARNILMLSSPNSTGKQAQNIQEFDCDLLESGDTPEPARIELQKFLELLRSRENGVYELHTRAPDGTPHWLRVALRTVLDEAGKPVFSIGRLNSIDREYEEKEHLRNQARRDSLTHIYNAATSRELITEALGRLGPGQHGALFLLDVDHFKTINDTFGHLCGDRMLEQAASALRECFREGDIVGRPGGDEFIVYMESVDQAETVEKKCRSVNERIRRIQLSDGARLTVSIGAVLSEAGQEYNKLYQRADRALYEVKSRGRDGFLAPRDAAPN